MIIFSIRQRWVIFLIGLVILLLIGWPVTVKSQKFTDVSEGTVYYGALDYLRDKGVIDGYDDGSFRPDDPINRAEALKMVLIASEKDFVDDSEGEENEFSDVADEDWFYNYVLSAVQKEIVQGYEDGSFRPANNINVAESLKIVFLAFENEIGNEPDKNPYPDVPVVVWYSAYAKAAKDKQIIWPQDDGDLDAGRDITRGEFAEILYRLMYMSKNELSTFPLSLNWREYQHSTQDYRIRYPYGWEVIEAGDQIVFWKRDTANGQVGWYRIFPNAATVVIAVDANEEGYSLEDYTGRLVYDNEPEKQSLTLNSYPFFIISVKSTMTTDYFFEMPNESVLVAYSQLGGGGNTPQLAEEIRNMIGSIRYSESAENGLNLERETFLSNVRLKILIEGEGQNALNLFDAIILVQTDTIGIGTGPIDYFYNEEYDVMLKYERNSDTLLGINDGDSTAF